MNLQAPFPYFFPPDNLQQKKLLNGQNGIFQSDQNDFSLFMFKMYKYIKIVPTKLYFGNMTELKKWDENQKEK